ncbi:unnamed protein product [Ixodes hexagonus]
MIKRWKPLISRSCLFETAEEDPFSHLNITSSDQLDEISERGCCPKCNKSRMYFCYTCFAVVDCVRDKVPRLKLPIRIDIVKHAGEVDGKSTAAHIAILAPDDVNVYTFPDVPNYDRDEVLLIFPGESAQSLETLWASYHQSQHDDSLSPCVVCHQDHLTIPWKRLVFIDSTWKQTKRIYLDAKMSGLRCAVLQGGRSAFWRPQRGKPSSWLATAEAVHLSVSRLLALQGCQGNVDDLLFFFKFFYAKIRSRYKVSTEAGGGGGRN